MEIFLHRDDFMRMYSSGIETEYKGKSVIYDDNAKTLLYYYYINHRRLYIIDGKKGEIGLPNVVEKVRKITMFEDYRVKLFQRYMKRLVENGQIFGMPDGFFLDLHVILYSDRPRGSRIEGLYQYYRNSGNFFAETLRGASRE